MKRLSRTLIAALVAMAPISDAMACTMLMYKDASGRVYTGRSNEFVGPLPDRLSYYPVGTAFESYTPDGKSGVSYKAKHAIIAVTVHGMVPGSKQDPLHEALNDQGLTFTTQSLDGNKSPDVSTVPADKVLASTDLGTWALSNFATVADVKKALEGGDVGVWLPNIPALGPQDMPLHFALFDRTGAGIVIEWTDGKTTVYDNKVGVMTNDPPFPWHLQHMNFYAHLTNLDKNSGQFNDLKVAVPDSGSNMSALPGSETSIGRFVKAAYYSNFAYKAKTPEEAILTLGHVMNNFDRPRNISVDDPKDPPGGERNLSDAKTAADYSEVTTFMALSDLSQGYFYLRTIGSLNYTKFDLKKLAKLDKTTVVTFDVINANNGVDGEHLFFK